MSFPEEKLKTLESLSGCSIEAVFDKNSRKISFSIKPKWTMNENQLKVLYFIGDFFEKQGYSYEYKQLFQNQPQYIFTKIINQ